MTYIQYYLSSIRLPSMYSHGPSYETRPVNLPDPYETKFTAKTGNDTAQIRGRRGFGSILAKAYQD